MAPAMVERGYRAEGRKLEVGPRRRGPRETTIALFITPGVTEFTIKMPRSAALMDRRGHGPRRGGTDIFK